MWEALVLFNLHTMSSTGIHRILSCPLIYFETFGKTDTVLYIACDLVSNFAGHPPVNILWMKHFWDSILRKPYPAPMKVCFFVRFLHACVIVLTHNFCIGLASFPDLVGGQEREVYTVHAFTKLPSLPCMLVCYMFTVYLLEGQTAEL